MATKLRAKQDVGNYQIVRLLNSGSSITYEALSKKDSCRVFFKQYKSPSVSVDWYPQYVAFQQELKRRIEASPAKEYAYRFVEFFESEASGQRCFYQVFEYMDKGKDLEKYLEETRHGGSGIGWEQRKTFAKLLMAGMKALHTAKIVHGDLKPANLFLIQVDTKVVEVGYRLKIVDLDRAVFPDKRAPWDGKDPYVGTVNYYSPEHLRGEIPGTASDVFTCGLILYELLAQGNPYASDDKEKYQKAALTYSAEKPRLVGSINAATDAAICGALYACLNPDPTKRPTAEQVHAALLGKSAGAPLPPRTETAPVPKPPPPAPPPSGQAQVTFTAAGGKLEFNISTPVGKTLCKALGEDAKYMSDPQFTLKRVALGQWAVVPAAATNETLINGRAVTGETSLKTGDVLAVGREENGIAKLPITVTIREG